MAKQPPQKRKIAVKKKPYTEKADSLITGERDIKNEYATVEKSPYFRDTLGVKDPVAYHKTWEGTYGEYLPDVGLILANVGQPIAAKETQGFPAGAFTARNVLTHEGGHSLDSKERFPSFYEVNRPVFVSAVPESGRLENLKQTSSLARVSNKKGEQGGLKEERFNLAKGTKSVPRSNLIDLGNKNVPMSMSEQKAFQKLDPYYTVVGPYTNAFGASFLQTDPAEQFAQAYTNAAGFLSKTSQDTSGFREKLGEYEGNTPGAGAIVRDLLRGRPIYNRHPLKGVIR